MRPTNDRASSPITFPNTFPNLRKIVPKPALQGSRTAIRIIHYLPN